MKTKSTLGKIFVAVLLIGSMVPSFAHAAEQEPRSVTLGSSVASAVTTYAFSFKPGTTSNIGAIKFQICDSPKESDPCVNTGASNGASFTTSGASIQSQSGISGFTVAGGTPPAPTTNALWLTNGTPQNITTSTTVNVTLQNVVNPNTTNTEYWTRVTTYSDSAGTAEVDYGAEAISTANSITVSGTMPESLVFCVGTSGTNCTNIAGSSVALGTFTPSGTNVGTSVMSASTNAASGYAITINGSTLTSGSNTIPAMGTQTLNSSGCVVVCTSTTGQSQWGTNVRGNNIASAGGVFGADPSGTGSGLGVGGYGTANQFRFFSGDTVASATGPTDANVFTNSYLVNVAGAQAAGLYTATMTYICTATF
jgi:hypothetical protein